MAVHTNETRETCMNMPLIELLEYYDDLVEQSRREASARLTQKMGV